MVMVLTATFNNISVIPWRSVLLVEETGENYRPAASHWQTLSHTSCVEYTSPWAGFELTTLVVIGTDCIGSCKSNYHATKTAPWIFRLCSIFCFSFDAYPVHVCLKYRLLWHSAIRSFLHTVYYDIIISCLFCIPFIIIQPHTVCFAYRLLWHNQILCFILPYLHKIPLPAIHTYSPLSWYVSSAGIFGKVSTSFVPPSNSRISTPYVDLCCHS